MKKYDVYGLGNALVDKEFEVTDEFLQAAGIQKGMMALIEEDQLHSLLKNLTDKFGEKKRASGGSAANTIVTLSQFGGKAFYSCKVADDDIGDFYSKDLKDANVDSNLDGGRDQGTTGRCLVMVTPDAERTMNTFLGITTDLSEKELNEEAIKNSSYLYIEGYLSTSDTARAAVKKARAIAKQNNVKTALTFSDPAMVQFFREGVDELLGDGVDLLFCNEDEAMHYTGKKSIEEAAESIKIIAKSFAITLGSKGALVFDGKVSSVVASFPAKAIDTNGAGDTFSGAFLYAITHGHSYETAARLANFAASKVVAKFGPRMEGNQAQEVAGKIL
jgi:sugar/nucleoside kinase (ribokinase family)